MRDRGNWPAAVLAVAVAVVVMLGISGSAAWAQDAPAEVSANAGETSAGLVPTVSVGTGSGTALTVAAPLRGPVGLFVTVAESGETERDWHLAGGLRLTRLIHRRVRVYGDMGFGSWLDGYLNPRAVWRKLDFRFGGQLYVSQTWGVGVSGGWRNVGDNFQIGEILRLPSEYPLLVTIFGTF